MVHFHDCPNALLVFFRPMAVIWEMEIAIVDAHAQTCSHAYCTYFCNLANRGNPGAPGSLIAQVCSKVHYLNQSVCGRTHLFRV